MAHIHVVIVNVENKEQSRLARGLQSLMHHPAVLEIQRENPMKKLATLLVAAALFSPVFAQSTTP
ncbi:MAG TPA: hypothetical protein VN436_11565, partial [Holophaga sp.]|nr:hypothetical protein [Holophaga sp.]